MKLTKKEIASVLRRSVLIILAVTSLLIGYFTVTFNLEKNNALQIMSKETEKNAVKINSLINFIQTDIIEDLLIIKNSNEFRSMVLTPDDTATKEVSELFSRLAQSKKAFDQIRFIDKDGFEKVRVNRIPDGHAEIVETDNLQYKGDRYYVLEAKDLAEGDFYFSPIDLNIENNEIEIPHVTIFRVATPVYKDREYFGLLIINHIASDLLNLIENNVELDNSMSVRNYLVNDEGYYIYNSDEEKQFAFMFDDVDYNIKDIISDFDNLKDSDEDIIIDDEVYSVSLIQSEDISNSLTFYLIQQYDIDDLSVMQEIFFLNMTLSEFLIMLAIDLMIIITVLSLFLKNKDRDQLALTTLISDNTNDAVVITDKKTNILFVNKAFERITGYDKEEIVRKRKTSFFRSGLHQDDFYKKMWNSINTKKYWSGELWDRKKNGLLYPKALKIYAVENRYSNSFQRYVGIFSDLTKEKESEENLEKIKEYHYDTNLPNQHLLLKLIDTSISNREVFGILCFSITNYDKVFINKDNKEIHVTVTEFISCIHKKLGSEDFLAQISTNTFVVGFLSLKEKEELKRYIVSFIDDIRRQEFYSDFTDVFFLIKGGASLYPDDGSTSVDILNNARIALEGAKKDDHYLLFSSPAIREKIQNQHVMSLYLKDAVSNNEFYMMYQPQVDSRRKKVTGAEALIRWNNPVLGQISPYIFIPVAEENGFISDIGYWVLETVFRDYTAVKHKLPEGFKFSINISPLQFNDENLVYQIVHLSSLYKVDLSDFELELTENSIISNTTDVNAKLHRFQELGLSISMDDFGTGFSSLRYLQKLEIDKIKIDRSFIKDYPERDNGSIAKIIVKIAKELNLDLITEGVETSQQLEYMNSIGCDCIQGFYFSRPLLLNDLTEYIGRSQL